MNQFDTSKIHEENKAQEVKKLKDTLIKDKIITGVKGDHSEYYENCKKLEEFQKEFGGDGRAKFEEWLKNKKVERELSVY